VGEWTGKPAVAGALRRDMTSLGRWRMLPTAANRQPAVAGYVRGPADAEYRAFVPVVLHAEAGRIVAMDVFEAPGLFAAFGLPPTLAD
jgi:RNA polymerase sigma-70 factor (ECF subfamily)